jgi:Ca-activated chloride channel homolog
MGKLPFLFLSLFLAVNSMTVFAQSRPKIDETVQKVNKRPPQTAPTPLPTATPPDENTTNIPSVTTSANIEGIKPGEEILTVDTNLVTIPVKISDRNGRLISGLKKADFKIFENNLEQEIAYFSNEEQPFTVALVLDMSYSTTFKINEIHSAASAFIAQLRPNDKVMIVSFDEEVHLLCEPTNDRDQLLRAIRSTKIATGTSLYEAVDIVINEKLVSSFNNESDASELDALIYPIQYDTYNDVQQMKNKPVVMKPPTTSPIPSSTPSSPFPFPIPTSGVGTPSSQGTTAEEYRKAGEYLEDMANRTGGRIYQATTTSNLATAFSKIANELREFYSLGYYPPTEGKVGERRKIKVKINQTNLAVRSRDSYIVGKKSK